MSYFDAVYMDHELSPRAKTVCMYLHDRANREGESWYAINTIASDLGLSRSTVKRALGDLVRQGRVEKKPRYRKNGGCTSNLNRPLSSRQVKKEKLCHEGLVPVSKGSQAL